MRKLIGLGAAAILAGASVLAVGTPANTFAAGCTANATTGCIGATVTMNQGALSLTAPTLAAFQAVNLNGQDATTLASWNGTFKIVDATGTGAGWHLTLGSPAFSCATGGNCQNNDAFPNGELTGGAFSSYSCAAYSEQHCSGTAQTGRGVGPGGFSGAGTTPIDNASGTGGANAPVEEVSAATNTGMGTYDVTLSGLSLHVPADAYAATYTTTITATLSTSP
ncbi:MAG TPA: WxL domain-containing protein [Chloroflexota bacterium]|nr:WxL domain-containing protein [Chloroflexota bacterium]